jgi:anti-anti-sigma factor
LVIDLSYTEFFGSSFIEVLFRLANRVTKRDKGRFAIAGLRPYCAEVLSVTHLDELWSTYETTEEAVADLKS